MRLSSGMYLRKNRGKKSDEENRPGNEWGLGNVIRGPVIMTPLITDNYCSYRARGVISTGPSRAALAERRAEEEEERGKTLSEN